MIERIQIEVPVSSDAQSSAGKPYLDHKDFIKYCNANGVYTNTEALETYEKKHLLYPCFRLLYPTELLKRRFQADMFGNGNYSYREEWASLINLERALSRSQISQTQEFQNAMVVGHPLENAFAVDMPYIVNPYQEKFKTWSRYNVVEGNYKRTRSKKSRATHYYSTWKIFFLNELNTSNTVWHNRATEQRSRWWLKQGELYLCTLNEYVPYLKNVSSFVYNYYLRKINYFENSCQTNTDRSEVLDKSRQLAKTLVKDTDYNKWIRFLRKLIELHENYRGALRIILSKEIIRYIFRTVDLMKIVTDFDFERICADVSGCYAKSLDMGREDGVDIYPGKLEELLADERWDLKQNVGRYLRHDLKRFNETLIDSERIPEFISEQLFEELVKERGKMALAAIRKMNRALNITELYIDEEMWSGICDLATSIEVHGREWFSGKYMENILDNFFFSSAIKLKYSAWRIKLVGKDNKYTNANSSDEFLTNLAFLQSAKHIPVDRRCGRHLLIAHLMRNYTSHQKGLTGKILRENLGEIYRALINTLFVLYAAHKNQ